MRESGGLEIADEDSGHTMWPDESVRSRVANKQATVSEFRRITPVAPSGLAIGSGGGASSHSQFGTLGDGTW